MSTVEYTAITTVLQSELSSLADTSAVESTAINNSSNKYFETHVFCAFKGTANSSSTVNVYVKGSDNNADFSDSTNAFFLGAIQMSSTTVAKAGPYAVSPLFGGVLPKHFKIMSDNESNGALAAGTSSKVTVYHTYYSA